MVCKGHLIAGAGFLWHYTSLTTLITHPKLEYQLRMLRKKKTKKPKKTPKILKTKLNNQKTKQTKTSNQKNISKTPQPPSMLTIWESNRSPPRTSCICVQKPSHSYPLIDPVFEVTYVAPYEVRASNDPVRPGHNS